MNTTLITFSRRKALYSLFVGATMISFGLGSYAAAASSIEEPMPPVSAAYFSCF